MPDSSSAKPLVLLVDSRSELRQLREPGSFSGRQVRDGFDLPADPWRLDDRRLLCVGVVRDAAGASDVVEAVSRGVSVAVHIEGSGQVRRQLLEDLHEVGRVEQQTTIDGDGPAGMADGRGVDVLDPDEQDLLDALVAGCTITEAATRLHLSRRTATRRLAQSRERLGVATTAEAMSRWAALRRPGPMPGR